MIQLDTHVTDLLDLLPFYTPQNRPSGSNSCVVVDIPIREEHWNIECLNTWYPCRPKSATL